MEILKEKQFKPKAHILTLLGEELIKDPVLAIYELVKNSYDADAQKVNVFFRDIEDIDRAAIIVEDDGVGMTEDVIENVWLEPGTDFRKPYDMKTGKRQTTHSIKHRRIPVGEKGIGRFAVHKLASKILLITRPLITRVNEKDSTEIESKLADYEIQLFIDWKDFVQSKYLSDVPIKWKVKKDIETFRFKDRCGTYIHLSGLKEEWTKGMARKLKGQIMSMVSPKMNQDDFSINLTFNNKWLIDFPSVDKILDDAPYKITALIDSEYNFDYEYHFKLSNNPQIGERLIKNDKRFSKNIKGLIRAVYERSLLQSEYEKEKIIELLEKFDTSNLPFGGLLFEFYSFDLDGQSIKDYAQEINVIKNVLKAHAGIKVFKGDMRIYDYGEPGNDWLGLDLKRIQNKEWFSNNQNIGYVYLEPQNSSNLIEKTNREGFINNDTYKLFLIVLEYILTEFKATRSTDRTKWLALNQSSAKDTFDKRIRNFESIINDVTLKEEERKELLIKEAKTLEEKYEEDKKTLLIPAGVGMTASVALHEIEKLVPRMEETVKSRPFNLGLISEQVDELKHYTNSVISVLRKGGVKSVDLRDAVEKAFDNFQSILKNRNITYSISIDENAKIINCDKRFLITMIMNVIDNSAYWLNTIYADKKEIYLKAFRKENSIHVIIADNGPGFKDDVSDIVRPFFSRKSDGIGIGLYLVDTIMLQYGKFRIVNDESDLNAYDFPESFSGATIELLFNKNQEI